MVVIRLSRAGSKKNPFYHVVVADHRMPRDGRFIEHVGRFEPNSRGQSVRLLLNQERITHWVSKGAKPSDRVAHLIKNEASIKTPEPVAKKPEPKVKPAAKKTAKTEKLEATAAPKAAEKIAKAEKPKAKDTKAADTDKKADPKSSDSSSE